MQPEKEYSESQLVGFGSYLLSPERRESIRVNPNFPPGVLLEERLSQVNHADLENWKELCRKAQEEAYEEDKD